MTQYRVVQLADFSIYRVEYRSWRGKWKSLREAWGILEFDTLLSARQKMLDIKECDVE